MTLAYLIDSPSPSNCVFVRGGEGETSRIRGERIESLGEYLDVGYSIETQRERKREKDRHDKKRRRLLLHEYNNRTIPFERRGAAPLPPVPRLLMRNIVNVDYVYQESVFPVLLY